MIRENQCKNRTPVAETLVESRVVGDKNFSLGKVARPFPQYIAQYFHNFSAHSIKMCTAKYTKC